MKTNFVLVSVLITILISGAFGLFLINDAFAQNLYISSDDSEAYKKQKEEQKKAERDVKQKEQEQKKDELEVKSKEKQKEQEQKKAELEINRQNLETKQLKKSQEYEKKIKEIKEKSQNKIEKNVINDQKNLSQSKHPEEKLIKKSEDIQKKLTAKSNELDSRTKNILDKINAGKYMGEKTTSFTYTETYELVFDSVSASMINDKSQISFLTGKMNFTTYDKNKSNLKLELDECTVTVDEVIYHCGFGKARSVSSGESGAKDSLVIVAFLESDVLEDVHTTLKLFLNADIPINKIEQSSVSILGPQSKISDMWFLNGTATLSKLVSASEKIATGTNSTIENGIN